MRQMLSLKEIIELDKRYFMNVYGDRIPVCFERGKGMYLWDTDGVKYTDFYAGVAVTSLGHGHPGLLNALKNQIDRFIHCSSIYYIEPQARLARVLAENSCADRVFFANSGAEANEGAIKLARIYFRKKGVPNKFEIITLEKSFHGRTLATIAATGQDKYQKPFSPLTPSFVKTPINDLEKLEKAINDSTCAVMVEPIQGESGVNPASVDFIKGIRTLCDNYGILLIFDEVQCGLGRTGKLFAYEHFGVEPDIFTLAKALGNGIPIGALCAKEFVASAFERGDHGSTFGGNPVACTAGLAVMDALLNEGLVDNSMKMGEYFMDILNGLKDKYPIIKEIRGKGLMIGMELNEDRAVMIRDACFKKGFLVGNVGENIIRFLPPLIVEKRHIDELAGALGKILEGMQNEKEQS